MTEEDRRRRHSLLCTVAFHGNGVARALRDEIEMVHGLALTLDKVRADLRVLQDLGAVRLNGDLVQITAEGREHAQQLRDLF